MKKGQGNSAGGKRKPVESPKHLAWMLQEAARLRVAQPTADYKAARMARHPWIDLPEAAIELDVTQGRISQLISKGILTARKHPDGKAKKQVRAADVFTYQTSPHKKTRTKSA